MNGGAVLKAKLGLRSASPAPRPAPRCSKAARLLALAHSIDRRVGSGEFRDLADAARALGLTRARVTHLVNLTLLAPAVQEEILATYAPAAGVTERKLREVVAKVVWTEQQWLWDRVPRGGT